MLKALILIIMAAMQLSAGNTSSPKVAEYGSWKSPITAEMIAEGSLKIADMQVEKGLTYWTEMRPSNKGFSTIVCLNSDGKLQDLTPQDFNVKSSVHEYGGGAFTVSNEVIYASCGSDSKIYEINPGKTPRPLTSGSIRFADLHMSPYGLVAVGESHDSQKKVENFLALIDLKTGEFRKLQSGYDFYSSPDISPDGKKIAWLCWNHPNMPWTHTELWSAEFTSSGELKNSRRISGLTSESICQPQWAKDGSLYFVSDRESGWWNLYRFKDDHIENMSPMQAEIGVPGWVFGASTYALFSDKIFFAFNSEGIWKGAILDPQTKSYQKIETSGNLIRNVRSEDNFVRFIEGYPDKQECIVQIDCRPSGFHSKILFQQNTNLNSRYISLPKHVTYQSGDRLAHGFFYPPKNEDYQAPNGSKPPLVVMIHGGPTAQSNGSFQMAKQFWTSRGFAILDVNYGGSTGYGRDYRNLLNKTWGIVDVEDCVNGALFLANKGLVDRDKLVIRGGSAGGYTTLAALAFHNVFKAGASYYGIADITALAKDTHKFESKYMELLVGPYPAEKSIWEKRSPINSIEKITAPLILFQGEEDAVVPKNQATMMYEALQARNIPVELYIYPGEQHGFRQSEHIIHSLQRELDFYKETFGIL